MITKLNLQDCTIKSYAIRKLTPKECFRLMGVRDNVIRTMQSTVAEAKERVKDFHKVGKSGDTDMAISASQQYKQAGNSIVVDVLAHIYQQLWYPKSHQPKAQASLYDDLFAEDALPTMPVDTNKGEKVILTTFSGYDSQLMAADLLKEWHPDFSWTCVGWSDIDKYACQMHDIVFPQYADKALGDITKIDWHKVKESLQGREVDLFTFSSPCFVAGTLVLTTEGLKPIEDVTTKDYVVTHNCIPQKVLKVGNKLSDSIIRVTGMCIDEILCTPNHPFYVREMYHHGHKWTRAFRSPQWKEAGKLTKRDYLGIPVNQESSFPKWEGTTLHYGGHDSYHVNKLSDLFHNTSFWYLMGRYVGDGWTRSTYCKQVLIACSDRNEWSLQNTLDSLGFNPTVTDKDKSCRRYSINSKELLEFVDRYGHGAGNKRIDYETLNLPVMYLSAFLQGYVDSDGSVDSKSGEYKATTVSRQLAYGIQQVVAKVHHRPTRLYMSPRKRTTVIEGRVVNQQDTYQVVWHTDIRKQDKAFYEDNHIWYPCNGVTLTPRQEMVFNMEVEHDNSYTANGTIVHNCQDVSQAGKQMGIAEGSGTRSALLWRVADAIEVLKPKYLLQENVAALVSAKFMPDFNKWLARLESMGYVNRWARLNAKNYGVPQNRDRVFCLSMRKDIAFDYQFPEPFALETRLEDVLEEDVAERYFLKDDAVSKFLKANDNDSAVYVEFDIPPTHEDAMFLKTYLQIELRSEEEKTGSDPWTLSPTALESLVNEFKPFFYQIHKTFSEEGVGAFSDEFRTLYENNLKRKPCDAE